MTILIDQTNKFRSAVSGGFHTAVNGKLTANGEEFTVLEYDGEIPEIEEENGEFIRWDGKKLIKVSP